MIVDGNMDEFPARRGAVRALRALPVPVTGDAVTDASELAELLDVHMQDLAGCLAFIADHRLGGFEIAPAVQAMAAQGPGDGAARQAGLLCNAVIGSFLLAECDDIRLAAGGRLGRAATGP